MSFDSAVCESEGDDGAGGMFGGPRAEGLYAEGDEVFARFGGWFWLRAGFPPRPKARL